MNGDTLVRIDDERASDPATILTAVRQLAPLIAARSDEIERERRLPPDLVTDLREAGCFRMLVPRRLGGAKRTWPNTSTCSASGHVQTGRWLDRDDRQLGAGGIRQTAARPRSR